MAEQIRSWWGKTVHAVNILRKQISLRQLLTKTNLVFFAVGLIAAVTLPMISSPITTRADASDCKPDTMNLVGSNWLSGSGVNVCSQDEGSTNVCVPVANAPASSYCSAGNVWSGTEWQCVELVNHLYLTKGWTTTTWMGNGNSLVDHVPAGLTAQNNNAISYVNPGDVITLNYGTYGHAAVINSIDSNGTLHIVNQNTSASNLYSSATLASGTSFSAGNAKFNMVGWSQYTVQAIIHHPVVTPPPTNPLHISAIHTGGGAEAKEGSLSAGWWGLSSNGATQVMEDGTLNGLVYNGQLLVNQGHPTNNWIVEDASGSVVQASISDTDGVTPIRIGLLRNDGTFWVKEGLTGPSWVLEQGSVTAGYVSGNRIAVLLSDGTFEVKEGDLGAGWVVENGSVSQAVISGGSGGLIGVVIGGTLLVKQGAIDSGWVTEQGAVANAQLSNATNATPARIGYIDTSGNYWVKEGVYGGWVLEQGGVTNAALSGNLISVVMSDGTYEVKQGGLGAGWVTEDGLVTQNALWSPN